MLSVNNGRSRDRSKTRDRSRTRDSSTARQPAPPPPIQPQRRKQAYDSDSEAVSDESEDPRYAKPRKVEPRGYDRYEERDDRRRGHEDDRRRRDDDFEEGSEDDRRHDSRYAQPSKYKYSQPESNSRHGSYAREKGSEDYKLPGAFEDYEEEKPRLRGGERHGSNAQEPAYRAHGGSVSSKGGMYAQPGKYEYAKSPGEIRYRDEPTTIAPGRGASSSYTAKGSAEIEVERRRHRRGELDEEALMRKYEEEARSKRYEDDLAEMKRSKEKAEKERRDAELIKKYERELELEKKKDPRQIKYKDEDSSSEEDPKYRRRKHSDDEQDSRHNRDLVTSKYATIQPKEIRPSYDRHDSSDDGKIRPILDRHESSDHAKIRPLNDRHDSSDHGKIRPFNARHGSSEQKVVEIRPRGESMSLKPVESGARRLSVSGGSSLGSSLMAPGGRHAPMAGGLPPGSPLLEAYRGTYQSISPMPSPMALPSHMDDGMSDLEPLDEEDDHVIRPKKTILKKRVEIYDPESDAKHLGHELDSRKPSGSPFVKVLPSLSHDNILALRSEYKKHFKSSGKGINITKHIKQKLTGNIGKIAYATALGKWEGEAYWANCWYQAGASRRELLVESLFGRSNAEIRKIKDAFKDKRYNDSLEKCMQTELKKDKFRHAVLLVMEEKRQDELSPILRSQVRADVDALYRSLSGREGGETAMIDIIVVRSDNHLREVLKEFEVKYKANFARSMIQKSQNMVGETLAHILNGVLNKPVRDALLLHQALAEASKDRAELVMSRLIRYHWDPKHLERIKVEYRNRYKTRLEDDIREGFTKGEFADFCIELCKGATR